MKIILNDISKKMKHHNVLNHISMTLESGHIYGLVGTNGCGKTMLLRTIAGLVIPTEGCVSYDGKQLHKDIQFPDKVGILIENPEFIGYLSGMENLKMLASLKRKIGKTEISDWMRRFDLDSESKMPVRKYSLGMKQKLGIVQAFMESPEILILDEPFNALDESSICKLQDTLCAFRNKNGIVIVTSHHKEDIQGICDEVFYMENGTILNSHKKD